MPVKSNFHSLFDENSQVIHNKEVMNNRAEKYIDDPDFKEFLNREFERTAAHATIEELAEFAFGSLEEAIKTYKSEGNQK